MKKLQRLEGERNRQEFTFCPDRDKTKRHGRGYSSHVVSTTHDGE